MMLRYHRRGPQELADAYAEAAKLAEERAAVCEECGDRKEAKQWSKIATYCRTMAKYRRLDDMNPYVDYEVPMPPDTLNELIAAQEMQEQSRWWRSFDEEEIPPENWRRPMKPVWRYALAAALQVLSDKERIAAIMYWAWRLPKDLIADAMGIQPDTLDKYLKQAQRKFARIRAEDGYLDEILARAEDLLYGGTKRKAAGQ